MKEGFENTKETKPSGTREAIAIISLIVSVILMLALSTRELILSDFGTILADLSLGIFGFSSYALFSFTIILSVVSLFTKKTKNNGLIIFSTALMIFSGLIALQVWTASAQNIIANSTNFGDFVNQSYNLKCIGLFGSSSGGAIMSALIYYPVLLFKEVGTYVVAGIIFAVSIFGIVVGVRKKLLKADFGYNQNSHSNNRQQQNNRQQNNNRFQEIPNEYLNQNPKKMDFASNINELRNKQSATDTNFQGHNFYDNMMQGNVPQQTPQQLAQPSPSAYERLYPNRVDPKAQQNTEEQNLKVDTIEEYETFKNSKSPSKLFVVNVNKNGVLNQKTKHEIHVEEKEKRRAQDILFSTEEKSEFVVDNSNRPKNLASDRTTFDKRVDTIRDDSTYTGVPNNKINIENKGTFPQFADQNTNIEFINKPTIKPNQNVKYDFQSSNEDFATKRKDFFADKSSSEAKKDSDKNALPINLNDSNKTVLPKKDPVVEMFKNEAPKQAPRIMSSSNYTKKEEVEEKARAVEKIDEKTQILEPKETESIFYTKKDYENNTRELKDLFSSGKINDILIEIPKSNAGFDKKMPNDVSSMKIYTSIDQVLADKGESKASISSTGTNNFGALSKAILNSPVDDAFNAIELVSNDNFDELKNSEVEHSQRQNVAPIYSLNEFENQKQQSSNKSTQTRSVFYPLNPPKEIKVPNGTIATQLPIIVKETHIFSSNKPLQRTAYNFPPMELLTMGHSDVKTISDETEQKSRILENILKSFSIASKVVETVIGPVITRYELEIQQGIPVKRVEQISKDITMGIESPCEVIIQAPIPGKNRLGIEVPNKTKELVRLRDVLDTNSFRNAKSKASYALGKEVDGKNVICDITKMPHLLIAGSTGTGKSVCLNTILVSLLYLATPEDVRLILIDPKRVEFTAYRNLPHLLIDEIICDSEKAISALAWAIDEMEKRFMLFQSTMTKDIDSYNSKLDLSTMKKLPRIVIIVDELADLLTTNKKELEEKIARLAQKSRAAGIHLILATQRPSVDVITGVIKTNLPSRISFKLSNGIDSKTVLDETGSEKLLGNGDMFYKPVFENTKVRVQGCFISGKEVEDITDYVRKNNKAEFDESIKTSIIFEKKASTPTLEEDEENQRDDKFVDALRLAIESSQISISMIQRRYSVGYNRAGKILDAMEKMGYVSSFNGSKPREVYLTKEQFEKDFGEF